MRNEVVLVLLVELSRIEMFMILKFMRNFIFWLF